MSYEERLQLLAFLAQIAKSDGHVCAEEIEALKEVATRVAEEAWLYNEYVFNISFDYIHCFCFNFCCYNKIFRIPPSPFPKGAPLSPQAPLPQEAGM